MSQMVNIYSREKFYPKMSDGEIDSLLEKTLGVSHLDIWQAVFYMYRYPCVGVQQYICNKIRHLKPSAHILPQLIHVFLYRDDETVSLPIYNLLRDWAREHREFSYALYFHLRSILECGGNNSIFCYFLICDTLGFDKSSTHKDTEIPKSDEFQHSVSDSQKGWMFFGGILLFFATAVSWMIHPELSKKLKHYEKIFIGGKNPRNINFRVDLCSGNAFSGQNMCADIVFLESLVEISGRLKKLPKHLRKRGLEMEIRLLNCNLPAEVCLPFWKNAFVLAARIEESRALDSAENPPFLVVFETADEVLSERNSIPEELKSASFLIQQLNSIDDLSSLKDVDIIRENIMESVEKILITERCEERDEELSEQKAKSIYNENGDDFEGEMHGELLGDDHVNKEAFEKTEIQSIEKCCKEDKLNDILIGRGYSTRNISHDLLSMGNKSCYTGLPVPSDDEKHTVRNGDAQSTRKDHAVEERVYESSDSEISGYRYRKNCMSKRAELKKTSKFKSLTGWSTRSVIIKTGNSFKQELIAYQILVEMKRIWEEENRPIWVYAYQIYPVNSTSGIVETVVDAMSIHEIKKRMMSENKGHFLKNYFVERFGQDTVRYKDSLKNFLHSLVGYSLASYILQIKDRHNGNIMVDGKGHIIHVDFGFMMGTHPGFYCVEAAPFKFSKEYLDLLEDMIGEFKMLFFEGYMALRRHGEKLCQIIEIISEDSRMECFTKKEFENFRDRFKFNLNDKEVEEHVLCLINRSFNSVGTGIYDSYQYFSYGYL